MIDRRCKRLGKTLVLRDWSHLDFTAVPFLSTARYEMSLFEVLRGRFTIHRAAIVRHPLDQWASLVAKIFNGKEPLPVEEFLQGYRRFAERCTAIGFIRFEDFTTAPEVRLRELCNRLQIDFDAGYRNRWYSYETITDDVGGNGRTQIERGKTYSHDPGLLERVADNRDYQAAMAMLGYD